MSRYRMPAEWEPHEATWLAWPHNREHWPGKFAPIPLTYVEIVRALVCSEPVFICVNDNVAETEARALLQPGGVSLDRVTFYHIPTNASWSRDHGPIFVFDEREKLTIIDWRYNANGEKWGPYMLDDDVPKRIGQRLNLPVVEPGMVLEGGSVDVNGVGSLLTTEACLLHKNRNPELSRQDLEACLARYLGATHVCWLKGGIIGDDTDGHVDDVARFVGRRTVACAWTDDTAHPDYEMLRENYRRLAGMCDQDGTPFEIVPIPMPQPVVYQGQQLPASYLNFYIGNTVVLLPTFRCPEDKQAQDVLQKLFPAKKISGVDCTDLVWGCGTIHCSTQQQPVFASSWGRV